MPWFSECGIATKNERIPRISTVNPTINRAFIGSPPDRKLLCEREYPSRRLGCRQALAGCFSDSVSREFPGKFNHATHRNSGWAFGDPGLLLFRPGGAGDIKVQPG